MTRCEIDLTGGNLYVTTNQNTRVEDLMQEIVRDRKPRRRGQAGSIVKRGASWTIIYRANGKQKWESGFRTKDAARDRLDVLLRSIRENRYVEPSDKLFREFCSTWMEQAKATLKPKTWGSYQSALKNNILPRFGDWPLRDVTRASVKDFIGGLLSKGDLSRKFIRNVVNLLHKLFEEAIDRDLIAANPAHKIKIPEGGAASEDTVVPTPEEIAKTYEKLSPTYQAMLVAGALTGFRRGELLGLLWGDIDWLNGMIHVRRTLQRIQKSLLDAGAFQNVERIGITGLALVAPKSKKSKRRVEMQPTLQTILSDLRKRQNGSASPFVFKTDLGQPIDPDAVYEPLYEAQDKAKVRRFGPHGLRHLYTSLLVASGADAKFAQERLGHASAQTTMNIYAHSITDKGREYASKVEAAFPSVSLMLAKPESAGTSQEVVQ